VLKVVDEEEGRDETFTLASDRLTTWYEPDDALGYEPPQTPPESITAT
jgi:hypothetical protein